MFQVFVQNPNFKSWVFYGLTIYLKLPDSNYLQLHIDSI